MIDEVIKVLDESNFKTGDCNGRALAALFKQYKHRIPLFDDYFHKNFEKKQVTGVPGVDEAMWHLIRANQTFWNVFEKVRKNTYECK